MTKRDREQSFDSGAHECYERSMLINWKAQAGTHNPNRYTEGAKLTIKKVCAVR